MTNTEWNAKTRSLAAALLLAAAVATSAAAGQSLSFPADGAPDNATTAARSSADGGGGGGGDGPGADRSGKSLFGWLGSFADEEADPYLAAANGACLQGDMTECFKARALSGLGEFFVRDAYRLNENVRVVRLPQADGADGFGRSSSRAFEYSAEPRPEDTEWDRLVKFGTRKVERFLRSAAVEVHVPDELTEGGRYSPRFIDEISTELDTLEDKKASVITKKKVKKLLVPLLIVLKLFKLKLLLFLPLILGLASFKKILGFLALVVPGLIGFFKLCKPDLQHNYGTFGHSSYYQRPPPPAHYSAYNNREQPHEPPPPYREHPDNLQQQYLQYESPGSRPSSVFGEPYSNNNNGRPARDGDKSDEPSADGFRPSSSGTVSFKDTANDMAYNAYNRQQ